MKKYLKVKRRNLKGKDIAFLFFVISVIILILLYINLNVKLKPKGSFKLYFYDEESSELVFEERNVPLTQDISKNASLIFDELKRGPLKDKGLKSLIPSDVYLRFSSFKNTDKDEGLLALDLSASIKKVEWDYKLETFFIYSLTNTLSQLGGVKAVQFLISGEKALYLSRYAKIFDPIKPNFEKINPGINTFLYFKKNIDGKSDDFYIEKRNIPPFKDEIELSTMILTSLINGPLDKTLKGTFPYPVSINGISLSKGILTMNFNSSLLTRPLSIDEEEDLIYSTVLSLTEIKGINGVKFLLNGKEIETISGHFSTLDPLRRFDSLTYEGKGVVVCRFEIFENGKYYLSPRLYPVQFLKDLDNSVRKTFETFKTLNDLNSLELKNFSYNKSQKTLYLDLNFPDYDFKEPKEQIFLEALILSFTEIPEVEALKITFNSKSDLMPCGAFISLPLTRHKGY